MTENSWKPFGLAVKDYYRGNKRARIEVFNDVAGKEFLTGRHLFRTEDELEHIEAYALQICKGKVLDIGAGAGSLSLILKSRGFDVKPIDVASEAVEVMLERGLDIAECTSIWNFNNGKFDTLLLMMNGIGIVGDLDNLGLFFEKAKEIISEDGQIIADSSNLSKQLAEHDIFLDSHSGEVNYRLKYKGISGEPYKWLFIDYNTLSFIAHKHGWLTQMIFETNNHYLVRITLK